MENKELIFESVLKIVSAHYEFNEADLKAKHYKGGNEKRERLKMARGAFVYLSASFGLYLTDAAEFLGANVGNLSTYKNYFLKKTSFAKQAKLMTKISREVSKLTA